MDEVLPRPTSAAQKEFLESLNNNEEVSEEIESELKAGPSPW